MNRPEHPDIPSNPTQLSHNWKVAERIGLTVALVLGFTAFGIVEIDQHKQAQKSASRSQLIDTMSDDEIIEKIQNSDTNWVRTLSPEEQISVFERLLNRTTSLQPEARNEMLKDIREYIHLKHKK